MKTEIQQKLEKLAYEKTVPFCYSDYIECPTGRCPKCGSDDLQRLYRGVGNEYGVDWIIEHILEETLTPVDTEQAFEDSMLELYNDVTILGFMTVDTVDAMKRLDPIAWDLACRENTDILESDELITSFDNGTTYYWTHELESLLEQV